MTLLRPKSSKCEPQESLKQQIEANLVLRLEGLRRLNSFKAHSVKRQIQPLLSSNRFSGLSELAQARKLPFTPLIRGLEASVRQSRIPAVLRPPTRDCGSQVSGDVGGSSQGSATAFPRTNQTCDISSNPSHRLFVSPSGERSFTRPDGSVERPRAAVV
jgi:hypothetical protein